MQQKIIIDNNQDKFFVAISHLISTPALFKACLFEFFNFNAQRFWLCDKEDLKKFSIEYPNITIPRNFLENKAKINPDKVFEELGNEKYILYPDFPYLLKEIDDFPLILYYKGKLTDNIFDKTLAIVGSRRASENAKTALSSIVSKMKNLTIVSGLAYGIDATAHKCAIDNNLETIGIIASGLDFVYPNSNRQLYKQIEEGAGIIMSEFPRKVPPLSHHFPLRNRIITGLCYGTIVAEAALKSGAMISANLTLEQNRELMCIPGNICNPNTQGIYKLLKNGATLISNVNDVYEALGWKLDEKSEIAQLNDEEKIVFDIISYEEDGVEKIQQKSGFDITKLMVILTSLEIQGLIKQSNSKYFITGK